MYLGGLVPASGLGVKVVNASSVCLVFDILVCNKMKASSKAVILNRLAHL